MATKSTTYIVIQQSAWCNDSGSGIYYSSDLVEFDKRDKAIKHGLKQCDSDDFNIGVLVNDRLTSLDWMNRVVDDEPEILAEISEHLGLDSDSEVQPAPKQWAAGHKAMDGGIDKVTLVYRAMLMEAPTIIQDSDDNQMGNNSYE